ncbi:NAD(P)/FAD-dependent oxidoreductase [Roseobacter sinensis]|uniref:FAD-binding oxidoreductase n=1 Tax=Roseobacter sinensis TaxID=2931391 RepID=A0ABT3BFG6_9RHOB|nr:FAD-dependent oxidoreductase [Roseobacter sp. WL0113]MCV3272325.1 FAD-binding oxidoreductase [Roseobacter sp. WL0113]
MKIIVVGAGIIGALTAYRLAQAGAEVTVIEARQPASAASGASFGWINASFYLDEDHFRLRCAALEAHRRAQDDLGTTATVWSGCLCWEEAGPGFDAQLAALERLGYPVQVVERAAFAKLEPAVAPPERALLFEAEGAVDLRQLAADALAAAAARGARLITGIEVLDIQERSGRVTAVETSLGALPADHVVVAAGVATQRLMQPFEVPLPMLHRPALILRSEPIEPVLAHVLVAPGQELRQTPDGRLLAPTVASHQSDDSARITSRPDVLAEAAMARVSALLNRPLTWQEVTLAARPMPEDGLPVIGACGPEGLYVSTMHSGATLAPLVAELAAAEVMERGLTNAQAALLAPYRPQRFTA